MLHTRLTILLYSQCRPCLLAHWSSCERSSSASWAPGGGPAPPPPPGPRWPSAAARTRPPSSASKMSNRRFVITEKTPTRAFSWLKVATTAITFKTLLRHYAKWSLTPLSLNVKLGPRRNYHKGRAAIRHYANQTARPLWPYVSSPQHDDLRPPVELAMAMNLSFHIYVYRV